MHDILGRAPPEERLGKIVEEPNKETEGRPAAVTAIRGSGGAATFGEASNNNAPTTTNQP